MIKAGWDVAEWQIRPPARACGRCARPFEDGERISSRLLYVEQEGYRREDICEKCLAQADQSAVFSWWWSTFRLPPPPPPEPVKRETAESLLRKLIEEGRPERAAAIFVLCVMLERRRLLVEREVQRHRDGRLTRIYEHRGTGESFIIQDPQLRLGDLEKVQTEVLALLSGSDAHPSETAGSGSAKIPAPSGSSESASCLT